MVKAISYFERKDIDVNEYDRAIHFYSVI